MRTTFFMKRKLMLLMSIILLSFTGAAAQTLNFNAKKSNIVIEGGSNMHGWSSKVLELPGQVVVDASAKQLKSVTIDIPVTSIKSDEKLMDKKTYETFKSDKNPKITFNLTQVKSLTVADDKTINATIDGNLTMAGVTKPITVKVVGKPSGNDSYVFTSTVPLKMTTFGMKPPTAMIVMKVKDDVTLKFTITIDGLKL